MSNANVSRSQDEAEEGAEYHTTRPQPLCGGDLSVQALVWVWDFSKSAGLEKLVLLGLANRHNLEKHGCWPSIARIASDCGISESTVKRCLSTLESLEEVKVNIRPREQGANESNFYSFPKFEAWWEKLQKEKQGEGVSQNPRGSNRTPEGIPAEPHQGVSQNPEPVIKEPVRENQVLSLPLLKEGVDLEFKKKMEQLDRARDERKARKANRVAGNFQRPAPRPNVTPAKIVTNKQPESWIWFSTVFKRLADANAFSHADLWPMVDEMLAEIGKEEAEERLSIFLDGSDKVTGYLAKDFLTGGWRTIDPEEHKMPRIRNEG